MLFKLIPFAEVLALSLGLIGFGGSVIVQCSDGRAHKKKAKKGKKEKVPVKKYMRNGKSFKKSGDTSQKPKQVNELGGSKKSVRGPLVEKVDTSKKLPKLVPQVTKPDELKKSKQEAESSTKSKKSTGDQQASDESGGLRFSAKAGKSSSNSAETNSGESTNKRHAKDSVEVSSTNTGHEKITKTPKKSATYSPNESTNLSDTDLAFPEIAAQESKRDKELSIKSLQETQPSNQKEPQNELKMEPRGLHFDKQGGILKFQLCNPSTVRQAVKIKCSDNDMYRVNPVYGYVDPGKLLDIEVVRKGGKGKLDKLVLVTAKAKETSTDLKQLFKEAPLADKQILIMPLSA